MRTVAANAFRTIATVVAIVAVLSLVVIGARTQVSQPDATQSAAPASSEDLDQLVVTLAAAGETDGETDGDRAGVRQLRKDLRAARTLSGDDRKAALADIRTKARAGDYGDAVQRRLNRRMDRRSVIQSLLPDELRTDLAELKAAPADDRADLRAEIMSNALDGGYGAEVQEAAEKLQELRNP